MARKSRKQMMDIVEPVVPGMKVWQAALYIRLSVEDKGTHGDSLETQRMIMDAYLALHPEIVFAGVYTDNGTTGRTFERPAFQRMLADAETGKIDCIIVKDLSRLGRNTIDTGYYIEKYFPVKQVRFIAVNDSFDSESPDNSGSHVILPFKNMMNEAYAFDISRKVRSQARQSMKAGEFIGARPPYGYQKAPDNCHRLIVNGDTAPTVRQIFRWAAEDVPLNEMVKRLNESGTVTPGRYHASRGLFSTDNKLAGSGVWQTWTVAKILADEVYTGDMVQGKTKAVGHKQVPVSPEDWTRVRDTHEPLVSRELFAQVQAVRGQAAEKSIKVQKIPYTENILRGRIFCGCCGKNLHRQRNTRKKGPDVYYFHCISNDRIGKGACEGHIMIKESELFDTILSIIQSEAQKIGEKNLKLKQQDSKITAQRKAADEEIAGLREKIEYHRSLLKGLYQNLVVGILTSDEYLSMRADYQEKIKADVERTQALERRQKELDSQAERFTSLAKRLARVKGNTALTAALVDQLIERITVYDCDALDIRFRFQSGFELVEEVLSNG